MATVWEAAESLLKMAGSHGAALAAARDLALICQEGKEFAERDYWLSVADTIEWLSNPQPLIAPETPSARGGRRKLSRQAGSQGLHLPKHRSNVLRFRKQLREIWERSQSGTSQIDKPEDDSK